MISILVKLNPQANRQAIRQELLSLQKVMETHHNSATELVSSIKARAPHISGAASDAFAHARAEMNKHVSAFSPDARKGLEKVWSCIKSLKYVYKF
jgi:inorganic triphosphatase YgiF